MDIILKDNSLFYFNLRCAVLDFCSSNNDGCVYDVVDIDANSVIDTLYIYKITEDATSSVFIELFCETVHSIFDKQKIIQAIAIIFTTKGYKIDFLN